MSTPLVDIPLPYGATMVGDGTQYAKLSKPHPKQNRESALNLPDGPCRVIASWAGNTNSLDVNLYEGRNFVRKLGQIEAGGGHSRRASARKLATSCSAYLRGLFPLARPEHSRCTPSTSNNPAGGAA